MRINYTDESLVNIERIISQALPQVKLTGKDLTIQEIISAAHHEVDVQFNLDKETLERLKKSYEIMMTDIISGKPVYGSNTSYGGQAGRVLNKGDQEKRIRDARLLSEGLVFLDVGTGPKIPDEIVKSAMLIRINMLLQGVSGVRLSTLDLIRNCINKKLIPVVGEYGGIAASGDLIHNERIVSALRGLKDVKVVNEKGKIEDVRMALKRHNLPFLNLEPKEGLGLVNGDNFSTAMAGEAAFKLIRYMLISTVVGAMSIEVLKGTDRSFHPLLGEMRPHKGQKEVAKMYRFLLKKSQLAFQELKGHQIRPKGIKVQDAYSLRCLAQFEGVHLEKIKGILNTITVNANSVSDNPLWVPPEYVTEGETAWQWVSGGNFLAMHMVDVLDSMRLVATQIIKKNDRHLARMIDECENNGLTANLSDANASVTQCTFKGVQIQSGMYEIYAMALANPVSILFGIHEERNQDITAHATTSGMLTLKSLDLLKYSLSGILLAVVQGVDLRGGPQLLSPATRPLYNVIRKYCRRITADRPLHMDLEQIALLISNGTLSNVIREEIFNAKYENKVH